MLKNRMERTMMMIASIAIVFNVLGLSLVSQFNKTSEEASVTVFTDHKKHPVADNSGLIESDIEEVEEDVFEEYHGKDLISDITVFAHDPIHRLNYQVTGHGDYNYRAFLEARSPLFILNENYRI